MTARPLEKTLRDFLKDELSSLNVSVPTKGRKLELFRNIKIIPDIIAKKEGYPTSLFSIKCWVGTSQIRETFAYAYFSKMWYGQKNIRVYMIIFQPIPDYIKDVEKICRPYIDGVYSLSGEPYFDELVEELIQLYK